MKILFLTNMPSYHQMELARRLVEHLGVDNFRIAFHNSTSNDRTEMGWSDTYAEPFVLRFWESENEKIRVSKWIMDADVVIHGRFPIQYVRQRIRSGRLTFAYQERYFKRKFSYLKTLFRCHRIIKNYWSVNRHNYHLLAAGAYTAFDLNRIGIFRGRSWKFGYFIEPNKVVERSQPELNLLWCARLSPVKQPEQVLQIASGLRKLNVNFRLTLVGDGELRQKTEADISKHGLSEYIQMLGWQTAEKVQSLMAEADIFIMTSNQGEGWGIVVNEAMSNACFTVVNRAVGCAPWLIEHGKTGLIYEESNIDGLVNEISGMSREQLHEIGVAGYRHITKTWSCDAAAQRLITLSEFLLSSDLKKADNRAMQNTPFKSGPCSVTI